LLDLSTKKVFISRDIKFYEHIFPFKNKNFPENNYDFFPASVILNFNYQTDFDDSTCVCYPQEENLNITNRKVHQ